MLVLAKANPVIKTEILQTPLTYILRIWLPCCSFRQNKKTCIASHLAFFPLVFMWIWNEHCSSFTSISSITAALQVETDALVYSHPGVPFFARKKAHFQKSWSRSGGFSLGLRSVRISPGWNGNFILQGLILAWASGKFLLNDRKLRKSKEFV